MAQVGRGGPEPATRVVRIAATSDVERARREARAVAAAVGLGRADAEAVALAVTELATNLVRYATGGEISLGVVASGRGAGVAVVSRDLGPGIADLDRALGGGYSTGGGLGVGLPGVRRLMDEFAIVTGPDGATIEARTWPSGR